MTECQKFTLALSLFNENFSLVSIMLKSWESFENFATKEAVGRKYSKEDTIE